LTASGVGCRLKMGIFLQGRERQQSGQVDGRLFDF